ncbi:type II toxin-antitoxin system Phd/YefM family antitoxin [Aliicoccus persicus]|uniref:Antitoxin n=1 Tax=Aliicoccus persicus TaxID=930138 RepID=A0A662Z4T8_9STAP|nr:type II toxin-antitoxin system prevent-host-death family antitoxin [Aliicoccus persicus]SEW14324.1 antitoxin YefM [Aliicoccus persicus]
MSVISYSNARKNFRAIIDKVNEDSDPVIITTKDEKNAVLISEADYNAIVETLYLTSTAANAKYLSQSISQLEDGYTTEVTLDEDN